MINMTSIQNCRALAQECALKVSNLPDVNSSDRTTLKTGTLTGATTYATQSGNYYYYDLSTFSEELIVALNFAGVGGHEIVVLMRQSANDVFSMFNSFGTLAVGSNIDGQNILKSTCSTFDYCAC